MTAPGNMSHAEIWDDSLLVDSWNEALDEYKRYHSIHARGDRVEEALKEAENLDNRVGEQVDYGGATHGRMDDPRAKTNQPEETVDQAGSSRERDCSVESGKHFVSNQASRSVQSKGSALPQHLIGQVHDENLKNLLMSWYYAGYYTGLYEGQQQGAASKDA